MIKMLKMIMVSVFLFSTTFAAGAARDADIYCGDTDGTSSVYFNLKTHKIWLNRDEANLSTAVELVTKTWSAPPDASPFSLSVDALHPVFGEEFIFGFKMNEKPDNSGGQLTVSITDSADPKSAPAVSGPVDCRLIL
jgi:hypothetical protein